MLLRQFPLSLSGPGEATSLWSETWWKLSIAYSLPRLLPSFLPGLFGYFSSPLWRALFFFICGISLLFFSFLFFWISHLYLHAHSWIYYSFTLSICLHLAPPSFFWISLLHPHTLESTTHMPFELIHSFYTQAAILYSLH